MPAGIRPQHGSTRDSQSSTKFAVVNLVDAAPKCFTKCTRPTLATRKRRGGTVTYDGQVDPIDKYTPRLKQRRQPKTPGAMVVQRRHHIDMDPGV